MDTIPQIRNQYYMRELMTFHYALPSTLINYDCISLSSSIQVSFSCSLWDLVLNLVLI